ncbi:DGQHR domain-containing protein [Flavobacterium sp. S87F.05.LMB.W.Kidney.N]|uniref:DGQHR domain-containing protein n=1 Tax=Flavobacterium sp. S87F.05.LMB.W.Kidney.N TaxID=1278758 RepID=UPI0010DB164C|nr:DGQHR domain-containing protein [Flavobacterium sp. S87F.05.LMB.W.Kidney.N]TDX12685.1 DGQHR domain-containing protein [Flavobacterium sp. S87F.05.LMB.W.Kidney.N]
MAPIKRIKTKSLKTKFGELTVFTQTMKIKDVLHIYYVAVRGKDEEEGSVQRVLNKQRINSIKKYVLEGNVFYSTFILNWTDTKLKPDFKNDEISIPIVPSAAQAIDGQHRLVGLAEALKEDDTIGEKEILVTLSLNLTTKEAARIFININSEQRPVPMSLIYDLFGEIENDTNHSINRSTDIAEELNENTESPYYGAIKYPGQPKGVGFVDLSTVVSSLKKHLESDGVFASHKLTNLQNQKVVILNYFTALKFYYDKEDIWTNKSKNPFLTNAGFFGAIEHLIKNLLIKCAEKKSFKVEDFKSLLDLPKGELIQRTDLRNLEGKSQRKAIVDFLQENYLKSLPNQDEYEF